MKKVKFGMIWLGAIFLFIGILFALIGAILIYKNNEFKKTAVGGEATIVDIYKSVDSDGDTSHTVMVEYSVDGKKYKGTLDYYTAGMGVGDNVKIFYDPNNPNDFIGDGSNIGMLIFVILGSVFATIGTVFIVISIKKKNIQKRLKASNYVIQANIDSFDLNMNLTVNGRHPFILIASAISPYDGKTYKFKSESIWNDLTLSFEKYNIKTVPVYVNPKNYKEYYVDIDYFKNYLEK